MKKIFMLLTALVAYCGGAMADGLEVQDVNISQGGEATLEIALENPVTAFAAFQFNVELADGITIATNDKGKFVYEKGERLDEEFSLSLSQPDALVNTYRVLGYYTETQAIPSTTGAVVKITIKADAALAVGTTHVCKLSAINLTETNETKHTPDDITFNVKITEKTYTILDETSTTAPVASGGPVDIQVKRTIKANEWSTIVLPFAMNETQLEDAFGDDVQLADFTGVTTEQDADDNTVGLSMNFVAASAIEANHPYLIKVSSLINEFTVDGVTIDPDEVVSLDRDELRLGSGKQKAPYRYLYNSFVGTYVANTEVPNMGLFLNGNKFWYSAGKTKMKAFRAYFDFYDILTEVEDALAEAKIRFTVDEKPTRIEGVGEPNVVQGAVYNVNGQLVGHDIDLNSQPKGIYFVDGKKVVNY